MGSSPNISKETWFILPVTSQLRTSSRKVSVKYVGQVVVYKINDPKSFLLCELDGKLLLAFFNMIN